MSKLLIGAVFGAALTFIFNLLIGIIQKHKSKEIALMYLKIEVSQLDKYFKALENTEKEFGNVLPDINIPELSLSSQYSQFIFYKKDLAEKVYNLSKSLEYANIRRNSAYNLKSNNENLSNRNTYFEMYLNEIKESRNLIDEIKKMIGLE